jgi:nitroreductase
MATTANRKTEFEVNPLFVQRWSPRAYTGEAIPDEVLFGTLEAARWAPSAVNAQPWRFIYSKRDSRSWATFLDLLLPGNRRWADKASALVVIVSRRSFIKNGETVPSRSHSFDAGAAWQNLALQATAFGWHAHAIGGFDAEKARIALQIPESFVAEVVVAIGKRGDKSALPPDLQEREVPNTRQPLKELALEGVFQAA